MNLKNIIVGWARRLNLIPTRDEVKELSDKRLAICADCKFSKYSKIIDILNGEVKKTDALICTKCHCPCLEKSLVIEEKCPINKW